MQLTALVSEYPLARNFPYLQYVVLPLYRASQHPAPCNLPSSSHFLTHPLPLSHPSIDQSLIKGSHLKIPVSASAIPGHTTSPDYNRNENSDQISSSLKTSANMKTILN